MPSIPANHQRAGHPIDLEERELVAPSAIPLLLPARPMDLCILVRNLPGRRNHMGQVEEAIRGLSQRPDDGPYSRLLRRLARLLQRVLDRRRLETSARPENNTRQTRFGKQHHAAALLRGEPDIVPGAFQAAFERFRPVQLHTRDLQSLVHDGTVQSFSREQ